MRVTVIPIVVGAFGTVPKGLEKRLNESEIKAKIETNLTTGKLISTRILRKVLEA